MLASKIQQFLIVFTIGLSLARFWRAFGISGGGGVEHPNPPSLGTPLAHTKRLSHSLTDFVIYGHRNPKVQWRLNAQCLTAQQVFQVLYDWFTFLRLIPNNFYRHIVGATGNLAAVLSLMKHQYKILVLFVMRPVHVFFLLICPPCSNGSPSLIQTFINKFAFCDTSLQ